MVLIIKTQSQIQGLMLRIREAKQPTTRESLCSEGGVILSLDCIPDCICLHQTSDCSALSSPHSLYVSLSSHIPSCLYLCSAGIKGVSLPSTECESSCLVSSGLVFYSDLQEALFVKNRYKISLHFTIRKRSQGGSSSRAEPGGRK